MILKEPKYVRLEAGPSACSEIEFGCGPGFEAICWERAGCEWALLLSRGTIIQAWGVSSRKIRCT